MCCHIPIDERRVSARSRHTPARLVSHNEMVSIKSHIPAACSISLGTLGIVGASVTALSNIGEACRAQRLIASGPAIPIRSLQVGEHEYIAHTEDGESLRIPRWMSLCVPPPDEAPTLGTVTLERIVLEWPEHLPSMLARNPQQLVVEERYYIVMPSDVNQD